MASIVTTPGSGAGVAARRADPGAVARGLLRTVRPVQWLSLIHI